MPCGCGAVNAHRRWRNRVRTATRAVGGARQRLCPAQGAAVEGPPVSHPLPLSAARRLDAKRKAKRGGRGERSALCGWQPADAERDGRAPTWGLRARRAFRRGRAARSAGCLSCGENVDFWPPNRVLVRSDAPLACFGLCRSADLGFRCARASLSLKVGWISCQNAVWWPEIAGVRARESVEVRSGGGMGRLLAYGPCGRRACRRETEEGSLPNSKVERTRSKRRTSAGSEGRG